MTSPFWHRKSPVHSAFKNGSSTDNSMDFELSADLAEICGMHAGDGYMRKRGNQYEMDISGHVEEQP